MTRPERTRAELEARVEELEARLAALEEAAPGARTPQSTVIEKLRQSQAELVRAQRIAHVGSWQIDLRTGSVVASDEARRIYGLLDDELTVSLIQSIPLPPYRPVLDKALKDLVEEGIPYELEFRIQRTSDGAIRDIYSVAEYDPREALVIGSLQDITERKRLENQLESIFSMSLALICIADIETTAFIKINPAFTEVLGHDVSSMLGRSFLELVHPDDVEPTERIVAEQLRRGEKVFSFENRYRHRDGSFRWLSWSSHPDVDRGLTYAVALDVTERKQAEERLKESEAHFRNIFEHMASCVAIYEAVDGGEDFVFVDMNPAGELNSKVDRHEIRGRRVTEVFPGVAEIGVLDALTKAFETGAPQYVPLRRYKDDRIEEYVENRVFRLPSGRVVALYDDRTEQQRLQERISTMEKMDAIGQLAGGVAHDFNNQLAGILGFAELLQHRQADALGEQYAAQIISSANRAAELTRKLLAFGRKGKFLETPTDTHAVVHEVVGLLERSIDKRIEIVLELAADPSFVRGDPSQLQSALLNLGLNARDAMPQGGILTIATDRVTIEPDDGAPELQPGEYVRTTVADTGTGMSPEIKRHLFEPFFTTKATGKGTGLGLASVYGTIKNHGGAILVTSEPGLGSRFDVYLPACEPSEQKRPDPKVEPPRSMEGRVLIVDDDEVVLDLLAAMLRALGLTVIRESDPERALQRYRGEWRGLDAVVLDMVMPRMGGRDLFLAMRGINPNVKAVLASGFGIDGEAQRILDLGVRAFIQKPFDLSRIAEVMTMLLFSDD